MINLGLNISGAIGSGFVPGEIVLGLTSGAIGTVITSDGTTVILLDYSTVVGTYVLGETVDGGTSGTQATLDSFYTFCDVPMKSLLYSKSDWLPSGGFLFDVKHWLPAEEETINPKINDYDDVIVDCFRKAWSESITYVGNDDATNEIAITTGWYYLNGQPHYLYSNSGIFEVLSASGGLLDFVNESCPFTAARYFLKNNVYYFDHVFDTTIAGTILTFNEPVIVQRTDLFLLSGGLNPDFANQPVELFDPTFWPPVSIIDITYEGAAFSGSALIYTVDDLYKIRVNNTAQEAGGLLRITYEVGASVRYEPDITFPIITIDGVDYDGKGIHLTGIDGDSIGQNSILYLSNIVVTKATQIKISHADSIQKIDDASFAGDLVQFLVKTFDSTGSRVPYSNFRIDLSPSVGTISGWNSTMFGKTGSNSDARLNYVAPLTVEDMGVSAIIDGGDNTQVILSQPIHLDLTLVASGAFLVGNILLAEDDGERFRLYSTGNGTGIPAISLEDINGLTDHTDPDFDAERVSKIKFASSLVALTGSLYILCPLYVSIVASVLNENDEAISGSLSAATKISLKFDYEALMLDDGRIESVFYLDTDIDPPAVIPAAEQSWSGFLKENAITFRLNAIDDRDKFFTQSSVKFRIIIEK